MNKFVKHQTAYRAISILAILGLLTSIYATYLHFSSAPSSICNINESFNCDIVNKGDYSEIFGVPVSVIGFFGYIWILALAREMLRDPRREIRLLFTATIAFAAGFQAHLAWISSQLLQTWCIVCIGSYVATFLILSLFIADEI